MPRSCGVARCCPSPGTEPGEPTHERREVSGRRGAFVHKTGIPKPTVRIIGPYQADLDGDGRDDVVVTASKF